MNRSLLSASVCSLAALLYLTPARAQNTSRFNFNIGGGFTEPVRHTDGRADPGFNLGVGGGVNFTPAFGVELDFNYNQLGIPSSRLADMGVPGGDMHVYSVTLNPVVHFNPRGRFDAYLTGGGGYYRRVVEFTAPSIGIATAFDPFFGFFNVPFATTQVLGSNIQNKPGLDIGGGVSVRIKGDSNAKFFAETRYHYIYSTPVRTSILPVTFGFRW